MVSRIKAHPPTKKEPACADGALPCDPNADAEIASSRRSRFEVCFMSFCTTRTSIQINELRVLSANRRGSRTRAFGGLRESLLSDWN